MVTNQQVKQVVDALLASKDEKSAKIVEELHREVLQRRLRMLDAMSSRDFWRRSFELTGDQKVTSGE